MKAALHVGSCEFEEGQHVHVHVGSCEAEEGQHLHGEIAAGVGRTVLYRSPSAPRTVSKYTAPPAAVLTSSRIHRARQLVLST